MHPTRIVLIVGLALWLPLGVRAQQMADRYAAEAVAGNLALKRQDLAIEKSAQALREAKGLFFPQVSFNASYTLAAGGRTLAFPVGDLLNPINATLNALTGSDQFPTNVPNVSEQFLPNNFHETKVRVIQPLFNSDIYFNYKARQAMIPVEEARREAYRGELIREVRTAYLGYLQADALIRIHEESIRLLEEIVRVNRRLVENQQATRDAVYSAEAELSLAGQSLAEAQQQRNTARAYVNFLLNRELSTPLEPDSIQAPQPQALSLAPMQDEAVGSRAELRQLQAAGTAQEAALSVSRYSYLPKVNAVVDAGFQGFGYNLGNGEQDFVLAQVSLQWDLFKGSQNRARHEQARIDQDVLALQQDEVAQQIRMQVQQASDRLQAGYAAWQAAEAGARSARQAYTLILKRYQQDQAILAELLAARTRLTQAEVARSIQAAEWHRRQAELDFALGR
ncbi:MAG: TolC family protein [Bacteroidia bacterium]|nr:TolC family protein [Bacteroidia bacterium]